MGDLIPIPLLTAVEVGNTQTVRRLIDEGADITAQSLLGITGLTASCHKGNLEIVDLLIKAGADLELGNPKPRFLASESGHEKVVDLLLKQGADINAQVEN